MQFIHQHLIALMWLAWALYWLISARGIKSPVRRESRLSRWLHFGPLLVAGWLLWTRHPLWAPLSIPFMARSGLTFWIAAAVTASGLLFSVWARVRLGRNWSGSVTIKADHELISTGPYRLARHPIYAGLLLALAGTALIVAEWRGALAFLIAFLALWRKLRLEERWLREQFGQAYAQRVAVLVPFLM